ncbi:MAG TPA: hypothetical protein VEC36_11495 [Patescibacteria group bacterium]|nr:hypothetical protein [Patescibacteria group bacterium]
MKFHFVIVLVSLLAISSCEKNSDEAISQKAKNDTIIGTREIKNEIAGGAYRMRARGYFLIVNNDTSKFMPIAVESNGHYFTDTGAVFIELDFKKDKFYSQQMQELSRLLPTIAKDFELDSLKGIWLGRLVQTGDLAVRITNELGGNVKTTPTAKNYNHASKLLKNSSLGISFNKLLNEYHLEVDKIQIEKLDYWKKEILLQESKVNVDTSSIPDKILDCMTTVRTIQRAVR